MGRRMRRYYRYSEPSPAEARVAVGLAVGIPAFPFVYLFVQNVLGPIVLWVIGLLTAVLQGVLPFLLGVGVLVLLAYLLEPFVLPRR